MSVRKEEHLKLRRQVFTDENKGQIPFDRGIYLAYTGTRNGESVRLPERPVYIGKGDDTPIKERIVKERIGNHATKDHPKWRSKLNYDGEFFYLAAELNSGIEDVEAAMIFFHKPKCNSDGVDNYMGGRPAPNVDYDIPLPPVDGQNIDMLDIINRIPG